MSHHHQAVNKLKRMGRRGLNAAARKPVRKCSACGSSHPSPTGQVCPAARSPEPSEVDRAEQIVAGEDVFTGRLTLAWAVGPPISSSPIVTATECPKRTVE